MFLGGCTTGNLTWTPTPQEWDAMTPEQRNEWSLNERLAREAQATMWQNALNEYNRQEMERQEMERQKNQLIILPPIQRSNENNSTYWQEKRAKQEYYDNHWP